MNEERVNDQMTDILVRQQIPELNRVDYETAHERFAYVAVRDILVNLGVPFVTAERLASTHTGPPRQRLISCVEHLR